MSSYEHCQADQPDLSHLEGIILTFEITNVLICINICSKIEHPNLGILEEDKHCWIEQLSFSVNTTAKSGMAVGAGSDDWNVSFLCHFACIGAPVFRTSYSLNNWIRNFNSTTTSTRTLSKSKVGKLNLIFTFFAQLDFPAVSICNQNRVHCGNLEQLMHGVVLDKTTWDNFQKMCYTAGCSCSTFQRQKRGILFVFYD